MSDIYDKITENDLTEDFKFLAEICGMDVVKILLRNLGGLNFYVPRITKLKPFIMRYIRENQGKSMKRIALELSVSEEYLRKMLKE